MSTNTHSQEHEHHVTPPFTLFKTLAMLAVFMVLTIAAAKYDVGHFLSNLVHGSSALGSYINNAVALTIAIIKASLVVGIFMGVKWGTKLIKMWAYAGFVWVVLLGITFGDYASRSWETNRGWYPGDSDLAAQGSKLDEVTIARQKRMYEEHKKELAEKGETSGH